MIETNVLAASLTPLVGMLGARNIQVHFDDGGVPYVDYDKETKRPKAVHFPTLSDDIDEATLSLVRGYVDHECAHLLFTSMEDRPDNCPVLLASLFNVFEDPRVEVLMKAAFWGSHQNLKVLEPVIIGDMEAFVQNFKGGIVDTTLALTLIARAAWGDPTYVALLEKTPLLRGIQAYIGIDNQALTACQCSKDVWRLAERVYAKLMENAQPVTGVKAPSSIHASEGNPGKANKKEERDVKTVDLLLSATEEPNGAVDPLKDRLEAVLVPKLQHYRDCQSYRIPTTDYDGIIEVEGAVRRSKTERSLLDITPAVDQAVNALSTVLKRRLIAQTRCVWSGGYSRGRLKGSNLYKVALNDSRVFAQRAVAQSREVAISLMIDCSGSMIDTPITLAMTTAWALSQVFAAIPIKFEVLGYTTQSVLIPGTAKGDAYARHHPLNVLLIKRFDEPVNAALFRRLSFVANCGIDMVDNVDGESLLIGYKRLMARSEARKIMMVLSDGLPASPGNQAALQAHLKAVAKKIEEEIELIAFGFGDGNVSEYYSHAIPIDDVNDLPTRVVEELSTLLI